MESFHLEQERDPEFDHNITMLWLWIDVIIAKSKPRCLKQQTSVPMDTLPMRWQSSFEPPTRPIRLHSSSCSSHYTSIPTSAVDTLLVHMQRYHPSEGLPSQGSPRAVTELRLIPVTKRASLRRISSTKQNEPHNGQDV